MQGYQRVGECGVTGSIIEDFILRISKEIKWKVKMVLLDVSLMNFIPGISKEIKWKVKVGLLEVSLMIFILGISKESKIEGEGDITRNIIDELHFWNIQGDEKEGESGVT